MADQPEASGGKLAWATLAVQAAGSLAWPVFAIVLCIVFYGDIREKFRNADVIEAGPSGFKLHVQQAIKSAAQAGIAVGEKQAPSPEAQARIIEAAQSIASANSSPGSVLWAVRDPSDNKSLRSALESARWRVEFATTEEEAVTRAKSENFDVIITSVGLKGSRTGLDFIRELEASRIATPVVLYTVLHDQKALAGLHPARVTSDPSVVYQFVLDQALKGRRAP